MAEPIIFIFLELFEGVIKTFVWSTGGGVGIDTGAGGTGVDGGKVLSSISVINSVTEKGSKNQEQTKTEKQSRCW